MKMEYTFFQSDGEEEWAAYHRAEKFLTDAGFSIGSMQRGFPTVAMFGDWDVSKWGNMTARERKDSHVYIEGARGTFRGGPIRVSVRSNCPAEAVQALSAQEVML